MMIQPFFKYCPNCRADTLDFWENKQYRCRSCGWEYFHNTAAAACIAFFYDSKLLLITRGREPGKGKLDIPGGFIDPGESAEAACIRETKEELGIDLKQLHYYRSYSNFYPYRGVLYATCDIIFWSVLDCMPEKLCSPEVLKIHLYNPSEVDNEALAFNSKKAFVQDISRMSPIKK